MDLGEGVIIQANEPLNLPSVSMSPLPTSKNMYLALKVNTSQRDARKSVSSGMRQGHCSVRVSHAVLFGGNSSDL